jgi:hypothetical protein
MPDAFAMPGPLPLVFLWLAVTLASGCAAAGSVWLAASGRSASRRWTDFVRWSLVAVTALAVADAGRQTMGDSHADGDWTGLRLLVAVAGILLATAILRTPLARDWPRTVAAVAALAVSFARLQAVAAPEPADTREMAGPTLVVKDDSHGAHALTDSGSPITLGRFITIEHEPVVPDGFNGRVIVADSTRSPANCHGWVFTAGRFQIAGADVGRILEENGYAVVPDPRAGDLIVYRDGSDAIIHTGLVKATGPDGFVLIESKWGPLDIYWHTPHDQVYSQRFEYRRSSRRGHDLTIVERAQPPAPARDRD